MLVALSTFCSGDSPGTRYVNNHRLVAAAPPGRSGSAGEGRLRWALELKLPTISDTLENSRCGLAVDLF